MARINRVFLRGAVLKPPQVAKNGDQFIYARVYVTVVRSGLGVADRDDLVCDVPLIMTRDTACIREIETWGVNDIVSIKGVFASRRIKKPPFARAAASRSRSPASSCISTRSFAKRSAILNRNPNACSTWKITGMSLT